MAAAAPGVGLSVIARTSTETLDYVLEIGLTETLTISGAERQGNLQPGRIGQALLQLVAQVSFLLRCNKRTQRLERQLRITDA